MRRIILLSLLALLAHGAPAQRRAGGGMPVHSTGSGLAPARGALAMRPARPVFPRTYGYGFLPYGYGNSGFYPAAPDYGASYIASPMVVPAIQPDPEVPAREAHSVVIDYKPGVAEIPTAAAEPQTFAIVLRSGATVAATTIVTVNGVLHYVDTDERHMQIALADVDRDATLRLNREHKLTIHLP